MQQKQGTPNARFLVLGLLVFGLALAGSAEARNVDDENVAHHVHVTGCDLELLIYGWNSSECKSVRTEETP